MFAVILIGPSDRAVSPVAVSDFSTRSLSCGPTGTWCASTGASSRCYQRGQPTSLGGFLWARLSLAFFAFGMTHDTGLPAAVHASALAIDLAALAALVALLLMRPRRPLRPGPQHLYVAIVIALHISPLRSCARCCRSWPRSRCSNNLEYTASSFHYQERAAGAAISARGPVLRRPLVSAAHPRRRHRPALWSNVLVGAAGAWHFITNLVDARIWRLRKPALPQALA